MRRPPAEYHAITRWIDGGWQIIDGWYADRDAAAGLAAELARDYRITTSIVTVLEPWPLPAWRPPPADEKARFNRTKYGGACGKHGANMAGKAAEKRRLFRAVEAGCYSAKRQPDNEIYQVLCG